MRKSFLVALVALPVAAGAAIRPSVGTTAIAGYDNYWGVHVFGAVDWDRRGFDPFASISAVTDKFTSLITLEGGGWLPLGGATRLKGALAATRGSIKGEGDDELDSLAVETGAERAFDSWRLGSSYRYANGEAGEATATVSAREALRRVRAARRESGGALSGADRHTVSVYAAIAWKSASAGLEGRWEDPSFSGHVLGGTVYWSAPVGERWSVTPALIIEDERDGPMRTYGALTLRYRIPAVSRLR